MPKPITESYQDYKTRVLDNLSPSFCGAKWYNATVWLGNGMTTSCHHPPAHKIPLEELKDNYKALHNTKYKKTLRGQMIDGVRPDECDYCWKVEDLGITHVSDRVFKSVIYTDKELELASKMDPEQDVDLKTLEIAFDSNCNFACSYCSPSFSTTWMSDIKVNGQYEHLVSDGAAAFQSDGSWAQPYGIKNENNPYVVAFMEWWEKDLQYTLTELRVTGGEAMMSQDFWKLIDWWKEHPECEVQFAVNSNLGVNQKLIQKLCDTSHSFKKFVLYTSNESFGNAAEYIRDGLVWGSWLGNIKKLLSEGNIKQLNMMMTINSLCLFSITEFMDAMIEIKKEYGNHCAFMSFNILRFPSFQSVVTLPENFRHERADHLEVWLKENWFNQPQTKRGRGNLHQMEYEGLERLIAYLREIQVGHDYTSSIESRQRDFKSFFTQYDQRRGKDFKKTFPMLSGWYDSIPVTKTIPIQLINNISETEGWIAEPCKANPGSQDYIQPGK